MRFKLIYLKVIRCYWPDFSVRPFYLHRCTSMPTFNSNWEKKFKFLSNGTFFGMFYLTSWIHEFRYLFILLFVFFTFESVKHLISASRFIDIRGNFPFDWYLTLYIERISGFYETFYQQIRCFLSWFPLSCAFCPSQTKIVTSFTWIMCFGIPCSHLDATYLFLIFD